RSSGSRLNACYRHDRRRALQGMPALRSRLPAARPRDVRNREPEGLSLSVAARRLHRLRALREGVPGLLLRGIPGAARRGARVVSVRMLMEGSAALAEAAVQAGCRFYAGYPITPSTEILEYMSTRLPAVGGVCMNAESELEAIGMVWGAAGCGVRSMIAS